MSEPIVDRTDSRIGVIHSFPIWLPQTQTWMYHQLVHLPAHVEAHVVCERTQHLDQFGVPNMHSLDRAGTWRRGIDRAMRKLRLRRHLGLLERVARRHRLGVLHSHFGNIGWADAGAARTRGLKHVVTFYGRDVGMLPAQEPIWRRRYRDLFASAHLFLCEGPHMASQLIALGCPAERVRLHHLGVCVDELDFRPRTWHPGQPLKVLIAATFREKKGIPDGILALARLCGDVDIELTIVGDAGSEPASRNEKARIIDCLEHTGLKSRTRLLGFQPQAVLWREAYRHHVFLSPSRTAADGDTEGGAPVSIIEMAASGMPVISTTHCDIPEVLAPIRDTLLAPEGDVDGLTECLRRLIEQPECWPAMLSALRAHVESEFDARAQGRRLAERYASL